jgi:hypothetical protein
MLRRLPLLIVLLVAVSIGFVALIAREITTPPRAAVARTQPSASVAATPAAPAAAAPPSAPNYTVVASRNLFSPTRTEAPPAPATPAAPPPPVLPKPNLFGVILVEGMPVAYLEDPVSKRVARYRVGDSVAGGTVKAIEADTVMLLRPEGQVTVRLHDPTRPRPAAPGGPPNAAGTHPTPPSIAPGTPIGPAPPIGIPPQTFGGTPQQTLGGFPNPSIYPQGPSSPQSITQPRRPGAFPRPTTSTNVPTPQ